MTTETSNARGEWPARYACSGPEGTFWTDDATLANKLIAAAFDRDEWTVTDTQNPTAAAPQQYAVVDDAMVERACRHWYTTLWDTADQATKRLWAKTMHDLLTAALAAQQQPPEEGKREPEVHSYDPTDQRESVTIRWPDGKCLGYVLDRTRYTDNLPPSAPAGVEGIEAVLHRVYMDHPDYRLTTTMIHDMAAAVVQSLAPPPAGPEPQSSRPSSRHSDASERS